MTTFHRSSRWSSFSKKARPIIKAALPLPCVNAYAWEGCTGVVYPHEQFDVAHIISHHLDPFSALDMSSVGAAHSRCNRRAGGREGRAKQLKAKAENKKLPTADSGW